MKKRKKLIKSICVFVCLFMLLISPCYAFASSVSITDEYQRISATPDSSDFLYEYNGDFTYTHTDNFINSFDFTFKSNSPLVYALRYAVSEKNPSVYYIRLYVYSRSPIYSSLRLPNMYRFKLSDGSYIYCSDTSYDILGLNFEFNLNAKYYGLMEFPNTNVSVYDCRTVAEYFDIDFDSMDGPSYNSALGYLQNVHVNHVFEDVPLGENVAEKYTSRWYYDNLSTTGVDLTSGDYMIRYYQERWIVTGYGADDVVKKSDRYLLGDYIVQNGYIQTYSEDIDSTLAGQGYEEPGLLDLLWNKFVTTHYYFQIVDANNNQVGGLLHVYLTDDNGKFGVEHIGETLDNEGNFDEGGYKDFIDEDKVTTDDVEQGFNDLENGSNVDFGTVDGVDEFGVILESFASQVSNVSGGVHALLSSMPPWVLGLLGVSFVLLVVGIIFKIV